MEFDALCDRFDDSWERDESGPHGISAFLSQAGLNPPFPFALVAELVRIDIERNWMAWDHKLQELTNTQFPDEIVRELKSVPTLVNYKGLFCAGQEFKGFLNMLATTEIACRHRLGDAIGPEHYAYHFKTDVRLPVIGKSVMAGCLMEENAWVCSEVFPLHGCTIFGRQNNSQDQLGCEQLPDGNRITIASSRERYISREHVQLQILNPYWAAVKNLSRTNPLRCAGQVLSCQQISLVKFPTLIKLPGRVLVLE